MLCGWLKQSLRGAMLVCNTYNYENLTGIGPSSSLIQCKSHMCSKSTDQKHARSDKRCGQRTN